MKKTLLSVLLVAFLIPLFVGVVSMPGQAGSLDTVQFVITNGSFETSPTSQSELLLVPDSLKTVNIAIEGGGTFIQQNGEVYVKTANNVYPMIAKNGKFGYIDPLHIYLEPRFLEPITVWLENGVMIIDRYRDEFGRVHEWISWVSVWN